MDSQFFEKPILNSPYEYPARHWELDESGQPTQRILPSRRPAEFITPIPKPRKQRSGGEQRDLVFAANEDTVLRHLLYVACTRARDHLWVSGVEPVSEFLDDLVSNRNGSGAC